MNKKTQTNKNTHKNQQAILAPPPPTLQKYERGKRMEMEITRDLPASFENCSLVLGSLFVKNNSYHISLLKQLVFSLWNFEIPYHSQMLELEIVPISAVRYLLYLMKFSKCFHKIVRNHAFILDQVIFTVKVKSILKLILLLK